MVPFELITVDTVEEAIAAGSKGGRYIAGGTTLIDLMREEVERPRVLVDINGLQLDDVLADQDELVIGALARMADVATHPLVLTCHPMIAEALVEGASPQIRNMASVAGNLLQRVRCPYFRMLDAPCNKRSPGAGCAAIEREYDGHAILGTSDRCVAVHPSDLAVALIALDASMRVRGPQGERAFAVEDLFRAPGENPQMEHTLRDGELIVEVRIPRPVQPWRARYLKLRDRASYEFALVSAATALNVHDGIVRGARIAVGGVATRPWRLRDCEAVLVGREANSATFVESVTPALCGVPAAATQSLKARLLPRVVVRSLEMACGEA